MNESLFLTHVAGHNRGVALTENITRTRSKCCSDTSLRKSRSGTARLTVAFLCRTHVADIEIQGTVRTTLVNTFLETSDRSARHCFCITANKVDTTRNQRDIRTC